MLRFGRTKTGMAIAIGAAAGAVLAGPAQAAPVKLGPGLGPSSFTLHSLSTGASANPRVFLADQTRMLAAFVDYNTSPKGIIDVCLVPSAPASACTETTTITPGPDGAGVLALGSPAPGTVYLTNGTANYTELSVSGDAGRAFGPPVRISNYTNAENFTVLPDGNLLLVGRGNDAQSNLLHVVVVPPSGAGLGVQGFFLPGDAPRVQRGVAYNGGRYVVLGGGFPTIGANTTQISYAVYSGGGDPNAIANWTTSTLPIDFSDQPNIADGPSGVILVALLKGKIVASKLSGTTFPAPTTIADPAGSAALPNVSQDSSGRITATWQVNGVGLRMSQSLDGVTWSTPVTINADRQFDTETATIPSGAGAGLAVTRASGRYVATRIYGTVRITLKASPKTVTKGKAAKLTATLTDDRGAPLPGLKVTFTRGKTSVGTATTGAGGTASVSVTPAATGTYRASTPGSATLASASGAAAKVKVKKAG